MSQSITYKKEFAFFYNGPFSNWYPSDFVVDGVKYNCGEQYMMHQKALFFEDNLVARLIMLTPKPAKQKELGRSVKNYNEDEWERVRYDIVKKGLREKFRQDKHLKELLIANKKYTIVEASPVDRVWGIGFDERTAMQNIDQWGRNLLGKILTELSNE